MARDAPAVQISNGKTVHARQIFDTRFSHTHLALKTPLEVGHWTQYIETIAGYSKTNSRHNSFVASVYTHTRAHACTGYDPPGYGLIPGLSGTVTCP